MKLLATLSLATALVVGSAAVATSIGEPDAAIKYRKDSMAAVGGHIRAMVAGLKGEVNDPAGVAAHARALAAATDPALLKAAFGQNTHGMGTVETTSTAKIWEDWDGFAEQIDKLNAAAIEIAALADKGELTEFDQLLPALGTCGACHRELGYRER